MLNVFFSVVLTFVVGMFMYQALNNLTIVCIEEKEVYMYKQKSTYENWVCVFGDNVLFWLLPAGGPSGDGITWKKNPDNNPQPNNN